MAKYILKRLGQLVLTLIAISIITFLIVRIIPGDPLSNLYGVQDGDGVDPEYIQQQRDAYGLNDPLPVQYFNYMKNLFKGDLGTSIITRKPIVEELRERYPHTIILALGSTLIGSALGIVFGMIAATQHNKLGDSVISIISMLTVSTPSFFLALLLQLLFAVYLKILPSGGIRGATYYILPMATLGLRAVGMIARTTRSSMLDVINQDYIRTSKSRGIPKWTIVTSHTFKNAMIPVMTAISLRFGGFMAGSALVETVFSIRGVGRFLIDGVGNRDYPVVQSTILVLAGSFVIINTIVDMLYALVNPRVKEGGGV